MQSEPQTIHLKPTLEHNYQEPDRRFPTSTTPRGATSCAWTTPRASWRSTAASPTSAPYKPGKTILGILPM